MEEEEEEDVANKDDTVVVRGNFSLQRTFVGPKIRNLFAHSGLSLSLQMLLRGVGVVLSIISYYL